MMYRIDDQRSEISIFIIYEGKHIRKYNAVDVLLTAKLKKLVVKGEILNRFRCECVESV